MKPDEKKCPRCAESIKREARVCRLCGYEFSADELASEQHAAKRKARQTLYGGIGCFAFLLVIVLSVATCASMSDEEYANDLDMVTNSQETADQKATREARVQYMRDSGLRCLRSSDGSHYSLVNQVKARLLDPDSFEHIDTRVAPAVKGQHPIFMRYRALNRAGVLAPDIVEGRMDHETCAVGVTDWGDE